jgi:hypothetical protein
MVREVEAMLLGSCVKSEDESDLEDVIVKNESAPNSAKSQDARRAARPSPETARY